MTEQERDLGTGIPLVIKIDWIAVDLETEIIGIRLKTGTWVAPGKGLGIVLKIAIIDISQETEEIDLEVRTGRETVIEQQIGVGQEIETD